VPARGWGWARGAPAALCLALVSASSCAGAPGGVAEDPLNSVQVALVSIFSGSDPSLGTYLRNSAQVEIDELNAGGGLLGRRVTLIAADDELMPSKAAELVRQHLGDDGLKLVIGPSATSTFAASRSEIDRAGIPNCLPTPISDQAVSGATSTFRTREGSSTLAAAMLGYLQRRTQLRRVGLIAQDAGEDPLLAGLAGTRGLDYVGSVTTASTPDPRTQIEQLAGRGAQAVILPADVGAAVQAVEAIQGLGLGDRLQALGPGELASPAFSEAAGDAAVGTILTAPNRDYLGDLPQPAWPGAYRTFANRIMARYGYAADGVEIKGLPEGADCVALWARAVRRANTFDGASVVRAWESLSVAREETVLGVPETFSHTEHDGVTADDLFVYRWVRRGQQLHLQQLASR
jgi:branched-chain amino acid transport system substrate-binding protein